MIKNMIFPFYYGLFGLIVLFLSQIFSSTYNGTNQSIEIITLIIISTIIFVPINFKSQTLEKDTSSDMLAVTHIRQSLAYYTLLVIIITIYIQDPNTKFSWRGDKFIMMSFITSLMAIVINLFYLLKQKYLAKK